MFDQPQNLFCPARSELYPKRRYYPEIHSSRKKSNIRPPLERRRNRIEEEIGGGVVYKGRVGSSNAVHV